MKSVPRKFPKDTGFQAPQPPSKLRERLIGLAGLAIVIGGFFVVLPIMDAIGADRDRGAVLAGLVPTAVLLLISKVWGLAAIVVAVGAIIIGSLFVWP